MAKLLNTPDDLSKFVGKQITEESLLGRGYFHCVGGEVVSTPYSNFPDFELGKPEEGEEEIMCLDAEKYLAESVCQRTDDCWVTCHPANPEELQCESYYLLLVTVEEKDGALFTTSMLPLIRIVEQMGCGLYFVSGESTLNSQFYEFLWTAEELINEAAHLTEGRFVPDGFSLIGKPMPEHKEVFHPNPPYSLAGDSGYRNIYWELSVHVNENDVIEGLEISTYESERGMIMRPHPMKDDILDAHKALISIADLYSEEEWQNINK
ncbi:MAG: hypothetical protein HUK02_07260 [Bacteroidaceae bacterium]|nr:hypothetical protein [Bacteroidaceae bacterium]